MNKLKKINSINKKLFFLLLVLSLLSSQVFSISIKNNVSNDNETVDKENDIFFQKNYFALLIGINDYPGDWGDLPYSINEINSFKKTLLDKGNWDEENIKMITDSDATHDNIINNLELLGEKEKKFDISIIYFVGHGGSLNQNYSFSTYDAKIFDYELDSIFDGFDGRIVLIMDCCNSGGFVETVKGKGRVIMAACEKDGLTYQYKPLKSGFFGYFLNLTLDKYTYTAEGSFIIAAPLTYIYSKKISDELGKDYIVRPTASDRTLGFIRLIRPFWTKLFSKSVNNEILINNNISEDDIYIL